MPSGVLQRSQRLAIGQDNRPIEALIPRHDANSATGPGTLSHRMESDGSAVMIEPIPRPMPASVNKFTQGEFLRIARTSRAARPFRVSNPSGIAGHEKAEAWSIQMEDCRRQFSNHRP